MQICSGVTWIKEQWTRLRASRLSVGVAQLVPRRLLQDKEGGFNLEVRELKVSLQFLQKILLSRSIAMAWNLLEFH